MRHTFSAIVIALALSIFDMPTALAVTPASAADTIYVVLKDGSMDVFPRALVKSCARQGTTLHVVALDGTDFSYPISNIESWQSPAVAAVPSITSFKLNNKFNHQVYTDVVFDISADNVISADVPAIGHWLTPSIQLSDKRAQVYVDDTVAIQSKYSRTRFGSSHRLTAAYPGMRVLRAYEIAQDNDDADYTATEITLTADMLATNAPSNYPEKEDLDRMIDGDATTFFHSTWGTGAYEKLPADVAPYVEIQLPEAVYALQYSFTNRHDTGERSTTVMSLQASADGQTWQQYNLFSEDNGINTASGATNLSPVVDFPSPMRYVRLVMEKCNYHNNYLCIAELHLWSITYNKTEPSAEDDYRYALAPYGHEYALRMNWLADRATTVPSVYVNIENNGYVESKDYYVNATITIDGAGVFPDMQLTDVLIKGRGNSSWNSYSYTKNPYRLKFDAKVKPFGLTKGKSWVLLANRQPGSMTSNAIGMYAAGLVGTDGANHIVPVELYMNGNYWGSYNFTEKVGFHNNSIDLVDDTKACLLELDTYSDETIYYSSSVNLPVKIKEPDFTDPTSTALTSYTQIMERVNEFASMVNAGQDISDVVDVTSLARFFVVNELIENYEIQHPKSTFLYHEDVTADTCKFKWGPVWDLDWAFGYETNHSYFAAGATDNYYSRVSMEKTAFINKLRHAGEPLDRAIYLAWTRFMRLYLEELVDYCDDYYAYARPSLEHNNSKVTWSDTDNSDYATITSNAKRWLRQRAQYVYSTLTPYELTEEEVLGYDPDASQPDETLIVDVDSMGKNAASTRFNVYNMNGMRVKAGVTFDQVRLGLAPGLYIVNGHKMLVK